MRKIFIGFLFIIFSIPLFAQEQGYKITIELAGVDIPVLYVKGNYGHRAYIFDTVKAHPRYVYSLQNKKRTIPDGIYELIDKQGNSYMEFIVSQSRYFSIKTNQNRWLHYTVKGSDENKFFALVKLMEYYGKIDKDIISQFIELSPESLLAKYLKAQYLQEEYPVVLDGIYNSNDFHTYFNNMYGYLKEHFFAHIDFRDARLLRTPIDPKIDFFFTELLPQNVDTLNDEIDKLIARMGNQEEVKRYYLQYIYKLFDKGVSEYDGVLVHLYDRYCPDGKCDWLDDYANRRLKRDVLRKRKTLIGQTVPPLEVYTRTGEKVSSKDIKNQYIVLWFWDPDCEDCIEKTPKLYDFYRNFHEKYDFEVMAISITEDYDRWIKAIPQFPDWINASIAVGEPNYDFSDYFDLLTTPGIFILDRDHKIIARQFPLEDILTILEH